MLPHPAGMNGELAGAAGAAAYAAGLHMSPQMSAAAAAAVAAYGRSPMVSIKEERVLGAIFHGVWEHLPCGCSSGGRAVESRALFIPCAGISPTSA